MLNVKKILFTIVAASCTLALFNISGVEAKAAEKSASQSYVEAMKPGWNLGNSYESVDTWSDRTASWWQDQEERTWGNPTPTKELIDAVKASGFKSIRMPFTAYTRIGDAPTYTIKKSYIDKYAEIVKYALDQGLYVIADMNHCDWFTWAHKIGTDDGTALKQYKILWKQFAEYFKDYPETLSFEASNEPDFDADKETNLKINNEVNNVFREVVRETGGNNATRMLIFPNLVTNAEAAECTSNSQNILAQNDPGIIADFHYYSVWSFSVNIAGKPKFDDEIQKHAKDTLDLMYNDFTSKGIGVVGGEYSVLGEGIINNGEYLKYMDYVTYYAREKGITMMLWDNGYHIDRNKYVWKDQDAIDTIMNAANGGRASYTEGDTLYVNGKAKNSGVTTKLTLNGNELKSIVNSNNDVLVDGTDYVLENGELKFKPSYLRKIMGSDYGKVETLTLKFDNGPDWKMNINYYKMPVTSDVTGSSKGLNIPMQFNGARLATMEAIVEGSDNQYSAGTGVGPHDWTTYKQFKETFEPDYDNNIVNVKETFFNSCIDGNLLLKFHWEDGAVTTYKVTKSGNSVKGIAVNGEDTTLGTGEEVLLGDINGDGVIELMDYTILRKYVNAGEDSNIKINEKNADVNEDGQVDFFDLVALKALV
ncbi:Aryl-phospho-beta-D-glucosidase BglC, GH1 family [Clostridium sp. DSM 8431]|uniref:cellulase family glycosylhydrolase n=1 Tax=Clostridium sp. DSM 8431 TaxID=1761781 RepID=UPI0008E02EA1|nr:cellulase family glycosylhydrolase [Clostridium sp. DSM 8431]SFU89444.1 Aryl-phospho-beta-D-glucosidase BglC, GH1 family [Clostridium sp. DSM 8431]